jgi:hypothetical protein
LTTNAARGWSGALALAGALAGLGVFHISAPSYLAHRGFPLDDAWIHAVYAREFARSFTLAYNPGIAATGETAPLWPIVLAPIHWLTDVGTIVAATKLAGFALHAIACMWLALTLGGVMPDRRLLAGGIGALVAFHPHFIAAAVSGMEVPLAELVVAGVFWAAVFRRRAILFVMGVLAIGARPEVAVIAVLLPLLLWIGDDRTEGALLAGCAFGGGVAALVGLGIRSTLIAGMPLPATFYAKANRTSPFNTVLQRVGFSELLGRITLLDSGIVLVGLFALAWVLFPRRKAEGDSDRGAARAAVALFLSGMAFCAVSFALIPPVDPPAFYHQRYVLPGVMPAIAAIPLLAHAALRRFAAKFAMPSSIALLIALVVVCATAAPSRARHLSNDAQNIDDVQVAFGKALAAEAPTKTVWVVDAGAIRYFGRPFVVDTIGLNTPEILGDGAQAYLDAHPPSFLDVFPGWSRLEADLHVQMPARTFEAQTPYTVTSSTSMRTHVLVTCEPPGLRGRFVVRARTWGFRCSS